LAVIAAHALAADWTFAFDDPVAAYQKLQHRRAMRMANQPPTIADYPPRMPAQVAGFHGLASLALDRFMSM
jgi:hypothetical protein